MAQAWEQASDYLDMLRETIVDDIRPLLGTKGSAPHTVAREVFSYVDHLGALYVGTVGVPIDRRNGLAQVKHRFLAYLKEMMALVDVNYGKQAEIIYEMYRNGPIHEFDPKVLVNERGQELAWLSYPGAREGFFTKLNVAVRHLQPVRHLNFPDMYYLPVSTTCLVEDLLDSLEHFKDTPGIDQWNQAMKILNEPKPFHFRL